MAPHADDLTDDEPPSINPYEVLELEKAATADEVKSAYRKAALKHHPDKAPDHLKSTAHSTFQSIAFAYAILSDPIRRKRYDTTGSTAESIIDSDGFSWSDFYSEQYKDVISPDAIEKFSKKYKCSDEEKDDVLEAFTAAKGNMTKLYQTVMLSDPRNDEDRFRAIIDAGIASGDVQGYKAYVKESAATRAKRISDFDREGEEAMQHAKDIGVYDKLFTKDGGRKNDEAGLLAMIQKRAQGRSSFLDDLEAKYAKPARPNDKKRKQRAAAAAPAAEDEDGDDDAGKEPSEEAFQKAAARLKNGKKAEGKQAKRSKR